MNEETKTHVRLLDNFDDDVEMATAALKAETKHAEVMHGNCTISNLPIFSTTSMLPI